VSAWAGLTEKQIAANRLLGGPQRHTMLVGGSRSGKTFIILRAMVTRALRSKQSRQAIFRLRYNAARQSIWMDTLPKVVQLCFPEIRADLKWNQRDTVLHMPKGNEIWLGGLDDKDRVDRILGQEHCGMFFNECSQIPYYSVTTALTRLAQKVEGLTNRAYYDLNPVGMGHYTYRMFVQGKTHDGAGSLEDPDNFAHMFMNPRDNAVNLDPQYVKSLEQLPERQRRRFLEGRYVAQMENALWTLELLEGTREEIADLPDLRRIVVAIDPSGAAGEFDLQADQIGIVVAGIDAKEHVHVLEDATTLTSPEQWARIAIDLYHKWRADRVIAEKNFGGDMVRAVIHGADRNVPVRLVDASRGKHVRAEPVAAKYEQGAIHHLGRFPQLEDELLNFTTSGYMGAGSPNRADALVWAATELFGKNLSFGLLQVMTELNQKVIAEQQEQQETLKPVEAIVNKILTPGGLAKPDVAAPAEEAKNPNACPQCGACAVSRVPGGERRCNTCGHQFGGPGAPNVGGGQRADLWKGPQW
jgi:PBSX family phage terminase large subunit